MDALDRELLRHVQNAFPLSADPYNELGRRLGIEGQDAFRRVRRLADAGIIRRLAVVFEPTSFGFAATLVSAAVDPARLEDVAQAVSAYDEVTHCYERTGPRNLWFVLVAATPERVREILDQLEARTGIRFLEHRTTARFKLNAVFDPEGGGPTP